MIEILGRLVASFLVLIQLRFGQQIGAGAGDDLERPRFDARMTALIPGFWALSSFRIVKPAQRRSQIVPGSLGSAYHGTSRGK
jgi:hypothetical protein